MTSRKVKPRPRAERAPALPPAQPAGLFRRLLASLLDTILLGAVLLLVVLAGRAVGAGDSGLRGIGTLLQFVGFPAYFIVPVVAYGGTPGKLLLGLEVRCPDGRPVSYGIAGLRFLGATLSGLLLGVPHLVALFRADRRTLYDIMANTHVVTRPQRST